MKKKLDPLVEGALLLIERAWGNLFLISNTEELQEKIISERGAYHQKKAERIVVVCELLRYSEAVRNKKLAVSRLEELIKSFPKNKLIEAQGTLETSDVEIKAYRAIKATINFLQK